MAVAFIDRRYIVHRQDGFFCSNACLVQIGRGDGLPPLDRFGERLRQDFDAMLTEEVAIEALRAILRSLTRYEDH